jgi:predicted Zn-dependent protease
MNCEPLTEQQLRGIFCARTGRVATSNPIEYQAFLWGYKAGVWSERDACVKAVDGVMVTDHGLNTWKRCVKAIRARGQQ